MDEPWRFYFGTSQNAALLATTNSIPIAAFKVDEPGCNEIFGLQFHPEVYHSEYGKNHPEFPLHRLWMQWILDTRAFYHGHCRGIKKTNRRQKVVMALSGGVDSTVAATLIHRAIGKNLFGIFVDNGVLRKDEFEAVLKTYEVLDLNVKGVDAKREFYGALNGLSNPEEKGKPSAEPLLKSLTRRPNH